MLLHTYFLNVFLIAHFSSRNCRCEWGYEWVSGLTVRKNEEGVYSLRFSWCSLPPHLPTNLPDHLICERLLGPVKGGQGSSGHSIHIGKLITLHPTAQGLDPALLFQCPRLPHQSALWAEPLPLSWKPQVKSLRSLTNHLLCPSNTQTLLSSPGQVRLRS